MAMINSKGEKVMDALVFGRYNLFYIAALERFKFKKFLN